MGNEVWVEIEGHEHYQISNRGRVMNERGHILKPRQSHRDRPPRVALYSDGHRTDAQIHVLVARHFLSTYRAHTLIGFKDGDITNCLPSNLFMLGTPYRRRKLLRNGRYSQRVRNVTRGLVFTNAFEAAEYIRGDPSSVYKVLRGERLTHKGCIFESVDDDYEEY